MLNDLDSLTKHPEVEALLEATAADDYTMEQEEIPNDADAALAFETQKISVSESPVQDMEQDEEDEPAAPVVVKTGDPREHLNLVFIGHIDAGKSTLSGNILYLTDIVDKRTI